MDWQDRLLRAIPGADVRLNESMAAHTTFRIGGPAKAFVSARDAGECAAVLEFAKENRIPLLVLGNGSNALAPDEGIDGIVLHLGEHFREIKAEGNCLCAQAGAMLPVVSRYAAKASLAGLAFAAGIPGSVGGAVRMNAGAYGGEMSQVISKVHALDMEGKEHCFTRDEMKFGYRHSLLCEKKLLVTDVEFALLPGDRQEIEVEMDQLNARRREKQPLQYPSAGSVFKRPPNDFAGRLVQEAECKGLTVGGAQVSQLHANFIINIGGATARNVMELIAEVQRRVQEKFGVLLETEVCLLKAELL